jgi:hypothetical protein
MFCAYKGTLLEIINDLTLVRCFTLAFYLIPSFARLPLIYTKQPKSFQFLPSDRFCQAVRTIFVSIRQMDITLHKIGWRDRKTPISKLDEEPGKIGRTAWQNWSDVTKIGSANVPVNGGG